MVFLTLAAGAMRILRVFRTLLYRKRRARVDGGAVVNRLGRGLVPNNWLFAYRRNTWAAYLYEMFLRVWQKSFTSRRNLKRNRKMESWIDGLDRAVNRRHLSYCLKYLHPEKQKSALRTRYGARAYRNVLA